MEISREFVEAEIQTLEQEIGKAQAFLIQAQAVSAAYKMLLTRLDTPEPELQKDTDANNLSSTP